MRLLLQDQESEESEKVEEEIVCQTKEPERGSFVFSDLDASCLSEGKGDDILFAVESSCPVWFNYAEATMDFFTFLLIVSALFIILFIAFVPIALGNRSRARLESFQGKAYLLLSAIQFVSLMLLAWYSLPASISLLECAGGYLFFWIFVQSGLTAFASNGL